MRRASLAEYMLSAHLSHFWPSGENRSMYQGTCTYVGTHITDFYEYIVVPLFFGVDTVRPIQGYLTIVWLEETFVQFVP